MDCQDLAHFQVDVLRNFGLKSINLVHQYKNLLVLFVDRNLQLDAIRVVICNDLVQFVDLSLQVFDSLSHEVVFIFEK